MTEITSYNFLQRIRNLLCNTDYLELSKDFVHQNLDNQVAAGPKALDLTSIRLKDTIEVLEPLVERMKGKTKPKGVHVICSQEDCAVPREQESECMLQTVVGHCPASGGVMSSDSPVLLSPTATSTSSARSSSP